MNILYQLMIVLYMAFTFYLGVLTWIYKVNFERKKASFSAIAFIVCIAIAIITIFL